MALVLSSFPVNYDVVFTEAIVSNEKVFLLVEETGSMHGIHSGIYHILATISPASIHCYCFVSVVV